MTGASVLIWHYYTRPVWVRGTVVVPDGPGNSESLTDRRAFVWLEGTFEGGPQSEEPLDEAEFVLQPERPGKRFITLRAGQKLRVRNNDTQGHSFGLLDGHRNHKQRLIAPGTSSVFRSFKVPEVPIFATTCEHQTTEGGYIGVFDNRYFAVSGRNGKFSIPDVPPGTYEIHVWHFATGTHSQELTVRGGLNRVLVQPQRSIK